MRITCPECQSEFDVPFALLGPGGRKVRCASCRHVWQAGVPAENIAPPPPVENPYANAAPMSHVSMTASEIDFDFGKRPYQQEGPSFQDMMAAQKKNKESHPLPRNVRLALQAGFVSVALAGVLFVFRQPLTDMVPSLGLAYQGLGVSVLVPGDGASIDRLVLRPVWKPDGTEIELSTRLLNLKGRTIRLAPIKVEALGANGQPSGQVWVFDTPVPTLAKEETVPFTVTLDKIPAAIMDKNIALRASFVR